MDDATEPQPPAPSPGRSRRTPLITVAVAVVAVIVAAAVVWATRSPSHTKQAAPPPTTPTSTPPTPTTSAPATPVAKAKPAPKPKPTLPHDFVAAAAPTQFTFKGKGFTINATVCGMENIRPLDPPGEQHHTVCWVQHDFGFAPGSKGKGTTYVLGHAWAEDPQEVLNDISESVTRQVLPEYGQNAPKHLSGVPIFESNKLNGDVLTLRTPNGILRYQVRDAYAVPKPQAGYVTHLVDANVKNRVVLITCSELNGVDYDYNIVAEAYLVSSKATRSNT